MDCKKCDKILAKIKDIDEKVKYYKEKKDYYQIKHGYALIYGVQRDIIKIFQIEADINLKDWI